MSFPRFFIADGLASGAELALPAGPARHAQVLRLQPGDPVTLFDGHGGQWRATIVSMGRSAVHARVDVHEDVERESVPRVHLAVGLFAPERMDWLVEKATELGAASLTPLHAARSNVTIARANRRLERWRTLSARACEQCGRNQLLQINKALPWDAFLARQHAPLRWLLSPQAGAPAFPYHGTRLPANQDVTVLSGPEGGLTDAEEAAAMARQFRPLRLGPRILRAETAPLAALSCLLLAVGATPATSPEH